MTETQPENPEVSAGIRIVIAGRQIHVPEDFRRRVGDLVTTTMKTVGSNLVMAEQSMRCGFPLFETPDRRHIATEEFYDTYCGLIEPLMYLAKRAGVELQFSYLPHSILSEPKVDSMCNPSIGSLVFHYLWGTIEMGKGVKQAEIIGDVCRGFPEARVLVLGPHVRPLGRLCNSIRLTYPDITSIDVSRGERTAECSDPDAEEDDSDRPQLVFATYVNAGVLHLTEGTEYNKFDIALCLQPELLSGHYNTQFLCGADIRFRHYGLVSVDRPLSTPECDQRINDFGFRRVRIPASGYARTELSWVSIKNRIGLRNILPTTPPHETLQWLQLNVGRNSRIARAAKKLAGTDRQPIEGIVGSWISSNVGLSEPLNILIVASDTNQANELAALLPAWPILDQSSLNSADIQQNLTLTPGGLIQFGICTRAALDHLPAECNPNIIVNAAGGPHALVLPKRWQQHQVGSQCCTRRMIIDVEDHGTDVTRRWSQSRFRDYERNDIFECDEAISNKDQFSIAERDRFIGRAFRRAR